MKQVISVFNKLFVVWVILFGLVAYFRPGVFLPLAGYTKIFFGLTMFGVGMTLKPDNFINIFRNYKTVIIGVLSQFTIMPLSAFLIAWLFRLSPEFTLGLILAGSAPGAMASNVLCYLARADVAYSVSLTTVSTLLAPVLTPALTLLLASTYFDIPFLGMFWSVCQMVLIPLFIGLLLKYFFAEKVDPVAAVFPAVSTLFIAFICGVVIAKNREYIPQIDGWIFAAVILLNVGGLSLGYLVGKLARFDRLKKRALSIEIGMQNAGLGSVLALEHFDAKTALPAVIFVFICIFSASFLVPLWARTTENG